MDPTFRLNDHFIHGVGGERPMPTGVLGAQNVIAQVPPELFKRLKDLDATFLHLLSQNDPQEWHKIYNEYLEIHPEHVELVTLLSEYLDADAGRFAKLYSHFVEIVSDAPSPGLLGENLPLQQGKRVRADPPQAPSPKKSTLDTPFKDMDVIVLSLEPLLNRLNVERASHDFLKVPLPVVLDALKWIIKGGDQNDPERALTCSMICLANILHFEMFQELHSKFQELRKELNEEHHELLRFAIAYFAVKNIPEREAQESLNLFKKIASSNASEFKGLLQAILNDVRLLDELYTLSSSEKEQLNAVLKQLHSSSPNVCSLAIWKKIHNRLYKKTGLLDARLYEKIRNIAAKR